jgi:hypothetical protein
MIQNMRSERLNRGRLLSGVLRKNLRVANTTGADLHYDEDIEHLETGRHRDPEVAGDDPSA